MAGEHKLMSCPMRVRAFRRNTPPVRGYTCGDEEFVQQLQVQLVGNLGRWTTIDEEIVPPHVLISRGCFGDTGGWVSKFASMRFGCDGLIARETPQTPIRKGRSS